LLPQGKITVLGCSAYLIDYIRYTKALEVIKKHRKEQAQAIKELKLKLESLQNLKDTAHKV